MPKSHLHDLDQAKAINAMYSRYIISIIGGSEPMRMTMRTNLAVRTLMFCAVNPHVTVRKSDIATACNASENHLAQVIRTLGQHGFIDATRGRNGGLQLMRSPAAINIGSVFRIFEADLPFAECFSSANTCPLVDVCWLRNAIRDAVDAFYRSLDKVLLSDLVDGNDRLFELLQFRTGCHRNSGAGEIEHESSTAQTIHISKSVPV